MQHVDEGRLHAWLDGELPPAGPEGARALERHLEECAACRARADDERRIRDDASSILRRADPVEQPSPGVIPFPAPAPARRAARPWVALGWAASVLLALGIGWMARSEPAAPVAINTRPRPPAPAAVGPEPVSPVTLDAPTAADMQQSAPATGVTRSPAAPAPRVERAERVTVPPVGVMVPNAAPAAPPAAPPVAEAPPAALPPPPPPPPPPPVLAAAPPPPPVVNARSASARTEEASAGRVTLRGRVTDRGGVGMSGVMVAVPALAARTVTGADGSYTLSVPASSDTVQVVVSQIGSARQSRALVAESSKTVNFALAPDVLALEGVVATGQGRAARKPSAAGAAVAAPPEDAWRTVARAEAERELGRALVTVPNLPLLEVEVGEAEGRAAVRVTQRLPDGTVLTLLQVPGSGARTPRRCEAPASGATCITFTRSGVQVEASAPVPAHALRAHLAPLF